MIDYARLCDVICARLGSAGAEATASTGAALLHAMGAAAAELRRQRDAAQEPIVVVPPGKWTPETVAAFNDSLNDGLGQGEVLLREPNEPLIAANCTSPAGIASYIARLHRHIVAVSDRVGHVSDAQWIADRQRDAEPHECPADVGVTANCATCDMAADATTVCDVLRRELDRVQRERDEARAELDKAKQVQGACRERIYALLADDDLSDEKLRQFSECGLPEIHDALHQASGYAASECFTQGPAEAYLRKIAERERDEWKAETARLKDELRLATSPRESVGGVLAALKAERDDARNGWEHETNLRIAAEREMERLKAELRAAHEVVQIREITIAAEREAREDARLLREAIAALAASDGEEK